MKLHRDWITPLTIGSFLLVAVTGVLMFFHIGSGLNKAAHEWLSWVFLVSIGLHIVMNMQAFKKPFLSTKGRLLMAVFALVLGATFIPLSGVEKEPPYVSSVRALAGAPLSTVAEIARIDEAELQRRLQAGGWAMQSSKQSVQDLVGSDVRKQVHVLARILADE